MFTDPDGLSAMDILGFRLLVDVKRCALKFVLTLRPAVDLLVQLVTPALTTAFLFKYLVVNSNIR